MPPKPAASKAKSSAHTPGAASSTRSHLKAGVSFADVAHAHSFKRARARAASRVDNEHDMGHVGDVVLDIPSDSDDDASLTLPFRSNPTKKTTKSSSKFNITTPLHPAPDIWESAGHTTPGEDALFGRTRIHDDSAAKKAMFSASDFPALPSPSTPKIDAFGDSELPSMMEIFEEAGFKMKTNALPSAGASSGSTKGGTSAQSTDPSTIDPITRDDPMVKKKGDTDARDDPLAALIGGLDPDLDALFLKAGKHRDFLLKTLHHLVAEDAAKPGDTVDSDRRLSREKDGTGEGLSTRPAKRVRPSEVHAPPDALPPSNALPAVSGDMQGDSESGLSDYERRERKRLRTSRPEPRGPSEGPASTKAITDEKKSTKPAAPKTPTRRRAKKGVMEMMAAVGAEPVTPPPPSSSPTTTTTSTGAIIESRLLPPPRVNELHLDMTDPIARTTVRDDLYRLAAAIGVKSWNPSLQGPGHVKFCVWGQHCPHMDGELALDFLVFEHKDNFGNLSRMDISNVYTMRFSQSATRHHAVTKDGRPFIFLTTGFLESSQITEPSPVGLKQKSLKLIPHEGEHQRMSCAACTVFGFDSMKTQYAKHALQFSTRAEYTGSTNPTTSSPSGKGVPAGMFTGASNSSSNRVSMDAFSLPHNAEVPVYDARDSDVFDVNHDLPELDSKLPRWEREIPLGSFVVVGYTMTAFFSNSREWTLGLNIQWAIIVGTPESASV